MTQVHISNAEHTVTVDHDGSDLCYVLEKTQQLWDSTKPGERAPGPAIGFTSQIKPQWGHDKQQGNQWRPVRAEEGTP